MLATYFLANRCLLVMTFNFRYIGQLNWSRKSLGFLLFYQGGGHVVANCINYLRGSRLEMNNLKTCPDS